MNVVFYKRTKPMNAVNGSVWYSAYTSKSGSFKSADSATLLAPHLIVNASISTMQAYNYCYIAALGRYYFVGDMKGETSTTTNIVLQEDVLNSFWNEISSKTAYIGRAESSSDSRPFVIDQKAVIGVNPTTVGYGAGNASGQVGCEGELILAVAGG